MCRCSQRAAGVCGNSSITSVARPRRAVTVMAGG
jgi:hypothetical protein